MPGLSLKVSLMWRWQCPNQLKCDILQRFPFPWLQNIDFLLLSLVMNLLIYIWPAQVRGSWCRSRVSMFIDNRQFSRCSQARKCTQLHFRRNHFINPCCYVLTHFKYTARLWTYICRHRFLGLSLKLLSLLRNSTLRHIMSAPLHMSHPFVLPQIFLLMGQKVLSVERLQHPGE